ncbi:TadE/TadG family type IV pilus assembly protein [Massilia niastensis]|uniref:TadE/TadG family type IV pilus assembly protein n=1 Tax=Massilia niastensis TaxID=544911 RepID=UPI00035C7386|nr:TadE/TadG family type IV pilus assembly protein [Massilia niastensis]
MSATSASRARPRRKPSFQAGVAAIEVSLLALVFFSLVFGVIEISRLMYVFNSVQEATRRAASAATMTSHRDTAALASIRQQAVFRNDPGYLPFGAPVSDRNVRIDYLALVRNGAGLSLTPIPEAALPLCPRENRRVCLTNPNASNCIRFVRARICEDDGAAQCNRLDYSLVTPLLPLTVKLPRATTISLVESFGSMPEGTPCL